MNSSQHLPPEALDDWLAAAAAELGISEADVPIGLVLDIAADVAHGVARPAAPLSTFLVGLALGRGAHGGESLDALAERISGLARDWRP